MTDLLKIYEGGAAIPDSVPVAKDDVKAVVAKAKSLLPPKIAKHMQANIGSAGFKVQSGDIDIMVEAQDVVDFFATQDNRDPVKDAKQLLKKHFEQQGIVSVVSGRNVHIGIPYQTANGQKALAQVDVMVIHDAAIVAPWHQHGPRGAYDDPEFKGSHVFILLNSLAKYLNLKFDSFGAKLMNRDTNEVVGRTRKQVAKILIGPRAKESDLDSVKSIMTALERDPDSEGKLAQARQDAAKGLLRLPETARPGTAAWFRQITDRMP
jgi:hypothetical protein